MPHFTIGSDVSIDIPAPQPAPRVPSMYGQQYAVSAGAAAGGGGASSLIPGNMHGLTNRNATTNA